MGNYDVDYDNTMKCPRCGVLVERGSAYCHNCGERIDDIPKPKPAAEPPKPAPEPQKPSRLPAVLLIAVILIFAGAVTLFFFTGKENPPAPSPAPAVPPTTEAAAPTTQPTTEATVPTTQPTTEATVPAAQPATEATVPSTQPTTEATEPATQPTVHTHTPTAISAAQTATCTETGLTAGSKCSDCGEILEEQVILPALDHQWQPANCTHPETCALCGATRGEIGEHNTKSTGKSGIPVCVDCGKAVPVFLNELQWSDKNCKFYYYSNKQVSFEHNLDWHDTYRNGYIPSASDIQGNVYTYGMHLDSAGDPPYYVEYTLDGKYTTFTGTLASPAEKAGGVRATDNWLNWNEYYKVVTVYLDGKAQPSSPHMHVDSKPWEFTYDVTNVKKIRIVYTGSDYANEITVLFDGKFS